MQRRQFIKTSGAAAAGLAFVKSNAAPLAASKNKLPKWKGFNLLDFYSPDPARNTHLTPEDYFKWMHDWGFDFIRIPVAYPCCLDIDRTKDIVAEDTYKIDNK